MHLYFIGGHWCIGTLLGDIGALVLYCGTLVHWYFIGGHWGHWYFIGGQWGISIFYWVIGVLYWEHALGLGITALIVCCNDK